MKSLILASVAIAVPMTVIASGQVKSGANNQPASKPATSRPAPNNTGRARLPGQNSKPFSTTATPANTPLQAHAKGAFAADKKGGTEQPKTTQTSAVIKRAPANWNVAVNNRLEATRLPAPMPSANSTPVNLTAASQIYRVGVRDVLDIRLSSHPSNTSTLFTVLEGGLLEYPLAGDPVAVAGMTSSEIANLLRLRIKIFDNPTVVVSVREYASHMVNITGFVAAPGNKALRRDAMPLYALLAEASVLPEATQAVITRAGRQPIVVDLKDPKLSATMITTGDVIRVSGAPAQIDFFFVGGKVNSPGQKTFYAGLTLTQAILASGGPADDASSQIRISRQRADGRLITQLHDLQKIKDGKIADPVLQKGDRIELTAQD